jgi:integrase
MNATDDFPALWRFLRAAGCRPMDAAALTAEMIHLDTATAHQPRLSTDGPSRHLLYFSREALELVRAQIDRYKTGPLFRNDLGQQFSADAIAERFLQRMRLGGLYAADQFDNDDQ